MATAQMMRNETKEDGCWTSMFPPDQVSETKSTIFVKRLLAVAVSSITYLRALFPENAFGDRCLDDINLKILREDGKYPGASRVVNWLRGCFDALEKKYLRTVLIGIYEDPDDPDTVIEEYSFRFSYGDGEGMDIYRNGSRIHSASNDNPEEMEKEIRDSTVRLLRTIVLLSQTLSSLPDNVMLAMKLTYYDEVTPEDYNPPGFVACDHGDGFDFKEEPINLKAGAVATNFHALKVRVRTVYNELTVVKDKNDEKKAVYHNIDKDEKPAQQTQSLDEEAVVPPDVDELMQRKKREREGVSLYSNPELDESAKLDEKLVETEDEEMTVVEESVDDEAPPIKLAKSENSDSPTSSVVPESEFTEENKALCACGINEDDGMMILCAGCDTWQHAVCYAVINSEEAPEPHYCVTCANQFGQQCTDKELAKLEDVSTISETCLWRRTLMAVTETSRILPISLSKRLSIPMNVATNLVKRMEAEGFVKPGAKGKRFGKMVQKSEIMNRGLERYFRHAEETSFDSVVEQASNMQICEEQSLTQLSDTSTKSEKRKQTESPLLLTPLAHYEFDIDDSQSQKSPSSLARRKRRKTSVPMEPLKC